MSNNRINGDTITYRNGKKKNDDKKIRPFTFEELTVGRRSITALTDGQQDYIDTIDRSVVTLCAGVAGTGKTYIATAKAIEMYRKGLVKKILFSRPNVTCGKGLGFLPGELNDKFYPFIRPFQDALADFMGETEVEKLREQGTLEFLPPDYLNGSTFKDTIMLLDEAQNAEEGQLNMFLTRIGKNSRLIMTGNPSMCDLDPRKGQAYRDLLQYMNSPPYIDGLEIATLGVKDVVRSGMTQKIVEKLAKRYGE